MYLYVEPKMAVLLFLWEVNGVSSTAYPILGHVQGRRSEVIIGRMFTSNIWGFFPQFSEAENCFRISPFSLKKPRTANIVAHLISVAVFLCRAKPENPTAVTMPGFLCVDHSIVECWITTMSSGKRSQRLVSLAWLNPPRECLKSLVYKEKRAAFYY